MYYIMENKKLTCSDCNREFKKTCFIDDGCDNENCECEHCFEVSCIECAYDGYLWTCKKCYVPPVPETDPTSWRYYV
jgi:hypothetical protein